MGHLIYDSRSRTEMEDRALAHLQIVIINKLRRKESFSFSWKNPPSEGDGRRTIWIAPEIPLEFVYLGGRAPAINMAWVEAMMLAANTSAGLHLVREPASPASPAQPPAAG
ncbi:hypothetical protein CMsap09_03990 [Clavibacter michiganensis]|uniref:DUF7882 domain-containing protein n=1 Tax=Clavibacter michiganensis TaxID=28447 RepID=A0A251XS35_9MICO|nr:hypothetical protein CMsap09_03990 [Clavibacter michiganensis]